MQTADAIDAFARLVERAEATAERQPRAELARFQLQGLAGTLTALGDGSVPADVDEALERLRAFVAAEGGAIDRDQGERLREKAAAYLVLADDLGVDADRLGDLVARWDAAMASGRPSKPGRARRGAPGASGEPCPVCGEPFKRVNKHLSAAHPEEWAKRRGDRS
jgi:hypothetical protein